MIKIEVIRYSVLFIYLVALLNYQRLLHISQSPVSKQGKVQTCKTYAVKLEYRPFFSIPQALFFTKLSTFLLEKWNS